MLAEGEEALYVHFLNWQNRLRGIRRFAGRGSVWSIATKPYAGAHFAVFPPELPETCIKAGSREGDLVMDMFMGSGTTAEAAVTLNRRFLGIERGHANIRLQKQRMNELPLMFCDPVLVVVVRFTVCTVSRA